MIDGFVTELESKTSPYDNHRKYGEVLVKFRVIEPDTIRIQSLISFDPKSFYSFSKMLCNLADKHETKISGRAIPTLIGPTITKSNTFFIGLDQERLLKLYQKFGFEVTKETTGYQVMRSPK